MLGKANNIDKKKKIQLCELCANTNRISTAVGRQQYPNTGWVARKAEKVVDWQPVVMCNCNCKKDSYR